jgi:delta 1-pyrroline-5-carboxylate dehydrogenase
MVRSMSIVSIVLAMLGMCILCSAVQAQPGGGFGGGGMFGGGGPFGGGQAASVSSSYGRLLSSATVQKELELVDDQKTKITEANTKMRTAMREAFQGMQDGGPEEMQKKMQALQDDLAKTIESILLPNQLKRLKEIALQQSGAQAINDPKIQEALKLTDDQKAKIKKVGEDAMQKMRSLFEGGGDMQENMTKMREMRQDTEKQLLAVLTDAQKQDLEKMKGKKLEIPESELGGRGGRGGRGGFGGGGGGGGGN